MSKFLSLEWFKDKVDHSVEKVIEKKLDALMNQQDEAAGQPFSSAKLVNDVLTIVMNDGSVITKMDATEDHYAAVQVAKNVAELYSIVSDSNVVSEKIEEEKKLARLKALREGLSVLKESGEFTIDGDSVYFKGISRSLPQLLVEELIDAVADAKSLNIPLSEHEEYTSLKRFFMWCALNPRAEVAHELYRFLKENSFRITKQGFFVALRNVVTLHGSPELVHFISNTYNKVKAVWKKSPDDYTVFLENGEYKLVHNDSLYREEIHTSTTCPDCHGEGGYYDDGDYYEDEDEWNEGDWVDCETCDGTGEVEEYEDDVDVYQKEDWEGSLNECKVDVIPPYAPDAEGILGERRPVRCVHERDRQHQQLGDRDDLRGRRRQPLDEGRHRPRRSEIRRSLEERRAADHREKR